MAPVSAVSGKVMVLVKRMDADYTPSQSMALRSILASHKAASRLLTTLPIHSSALRL